MDKSTWAVGGGLLLGLGVGFLLMQQPGYFIAGGLVSGLGFGVIIAAILAKIK